MKARDLVNESQGTLVYFNLDGEFTCGSIDDVCADGEKVFLDYIDDFGALGSAVFDASENVEVRRPGENNA